MDVGIVVFCMGILSLVSISLSENRLQSPDFTSDWQDITVDDGNMARVTFEHGFGQVPVLVVVQTRCPKGQDKGFIFHAIGLVPRDDDSNSTFGAITYIYDEINITVSAMNPANNRFYTGLAVYTDNTDYWSGPSATESELVHVRALAWKNTTLPKPDFHISGKRIIAGVPARSYMEFTHGFDSYPSMVVVRTKLLVENVNLQDYYSDAVGSGIATYKDFIYTSNGYVIYGYDEQTVRIWIDNSTNALLFNGKDIAEFGGETRSGELEILAWKESSLNFSQSYELSLGTMEDDIFEDETPLDNEENRTIIVNVLAECQYGLNYGFRFPGSGAMAIVSEKDIAECKNDPQICSYGGLGYAYTNSTLRIWKPNNELGSIIAIPGQFGSGENTQRSNDATAVVNVWITQDWSEPRKSPSVEKQDKGASFTGMIIIVVCLVLMICLISLAVVKYFIEKRKRSYKVEPCWLVTPKEMAMKYPKPNIDDFMTFEGNKT